MQRVREALTSLRVRLILSFTVVVVVALAIVMASLPRLLDGYFARQEDEALGTRTEVLTGLLEERLSQFQTTFGTAMPRPIIAPTGPSEPPRATDLVTRAWGSAGSGYVASLAPQVAQANILVTIAPDPDRADDIVYRLEIPLGDAEAKPGQEREPFSRSASFDIADLWYAQNAQGAPPRRVTVTLTQPFSYRAQTLETIFGVLVGAAFLAVPVAIVAAVLLSARLTDPLRRLTTASRSLAEGKLDARVNVPASSSPEVVELAAAFNAMAERLQGSIGYISRDRDRSREFLADVSHELRTPIAALRTFNELLRDGSSNDPQTREEFLQHSHQQIERLDWLATNLLELSKLDSGLVSLDLRPDDLRSVVEDGVDQARPLASRKGLELELRLPSDPVRLPHDPARIGQVLANLLGNAIKFTHPGGRVAVAVRDAGNNAELVLEDSGVGIDSDELPHVFERFYRGSQSAEERASGSGLGLSIVRSIVEMHHGRVSIQSAVGRGTTVTVLLPREATPAPPGVAVSSPAGSAQ